MNSSMSNQYFYKLLIILEYLSDPEVQVLASKVDEIMMRIFMNK
jgi:hypothetical protein